MRPALIHSILTEALANGKHSPGCSFEVAKRKNSYLPDRHPKKTPIQVDLGLCNCWRKKATRLLKAVRVVKQGEIVCNDEPDYN